jgi:hypothetical protein
MLHKRKINDTSINNVSGSVKAVKRKNTNAYFIGKARPYNL